MLEMLGLANSRGLRVMWRDLGARNGEIHPSGVILLNSRRPVRAQRVTLAHELGHHALRHVLTVDMARHARQERQADEYAARLLISQAQYVAAEALVGSHVGALARELGVTARMVVAWRQVEPGRSARA